MRNVILCFRQRGTTQSQPNDDAEEVESVLMNELNLGPIFSSRKMYVLRSTDC